MEKKIEFRKFRPLPDSCTPLSSFEDPTEPENKIEYLCSTSLINAETGEETGIPVYHLKRTYPADGVKDYWDKRLLEAARKQGKLIPNYKPNRKKLELLSWLHSWFSNIFDDTEGDEWDE